MPDDYETVAYDHTTIRDRPKRLWTFMDINLPGLHMPGLAAGGSVLFVVALSGVFLSNAVGGQAFTYVGVLIGGALGVGAYFAWGKPLADKMSATQQLVVRLDWLLRQPRAIHGFTRDTEPTQIQWQLILWQPTDQGWLAAREHTLHFLRARRHTHTAA